MLNITTEYPIPKGDVEVRLNSIHFTLCNLIDELKFVLPQCSKQIDALSENLDSLISSGSSSDEG